MVEVNAICNPPSNGWKVISNWQQNKKTMNYIHLLLILKNVDMCASEDIDFMHSYIVLQLDFFHQWFYFFMFVFVQKLLFYFAFINLLTLFFSVLKAYVQQLESSRLKLTQLEQELQRARQQVWFYYLIGILAECSFQNSRFISHKI